MSLDSTKVLVGAAVAIVTVHLWAAHSTREVALSSDCGPQGLAATLRSSYQRSAFWRDQIAAIDREIARLQFRADFRMKERPRNSIAKALIDELQREYPETRPSEEKRHAQALRDRAHELEDQAFKIEQDEADQKIFEWLSSCRVVAVRGSAD